MHTSREALLEKIEGWHRLTAFAAKSWAPAELTALEQSLSATLERNKSIVRISNTALSIPPIAFCGFLLGFAVAEPATNAHTFIPYWPVMVLVGLIILTIVSIVMQSSFEEKVRTQEYHLDYAQAIAGSTQCNKALEYLESGDAEVLAWWGIALAERDQLYHFDVEIMGELHAIAQKKKEQEDIQAQYAAAFRKVHGLAAA